MPSIFRRRTAAVLVALALTAGCSDLDDTANAGLNHTGLVADLVAQLSGAAGRTYEARYRLAGGETATLAQGQQPPRAAYVYPGGKVLLTPDATTECRTGPGTCTMTAPATPANPPPAAVFRGAGASGMVTPATVLALLNQAALDGGAQVAQHDTTIAGRHATCVALTGVEGAGDFEACVTNEGVLGSFSGTVEQTRTDVVMTDYADQVSESLFELPKTAKLIDRR